VKTISIADLLKEKKEEIEKAATLGKRAIGIIVTDLNGERISFERAS